jgi:hypothetical protein
MHTPARFDEPAPSQAGNTPVSPLLEPAPLEPSLVPLVPLLELVPAPVVVSPVALSVPLLLVVLVVGVSVVEVVEVVVAAVSPELVLPLLVAEDCAGPSPQAIVFTTHRAIIRKLRMRQSSKRGPSCQCRRCRREAGVQAVRVIDAVSSSGTPAGARTVS